MKIMSFPCKKQYLTESDFPYEFISIISDNVVIVVSVKFYGQSNS